MPGRYRNAYFFKNANPLYENVLEDRGLRSIQQYGTQTFNPLTAAEFESLVIEEIFWQPGDRLEKIASRVYGNASYWWVLARFNQKPTDAHWRTGDVVKVPYPLQLISSYY
jgi:hypothetical protein